ncbi:MAG: pyrroline-5-carboxylate reductase [Thermodesulfobacteriota bacterium]
MALEESIGFIGGGQMAEALIKGVLQSRIVNNSRITVIDPDEERRSYLSRNYSVKTTTVPEEVASCGIVLLAVKPQIVGEVLEDYKSRLTEHNLFISIAAGIPISFIEGKLALARIIRVMSNIPALVLEGASALCGGSRTTENDIETGMAIFSAIGKCVRLEESYFDAVTGLSGSGPAYIFTFIDAMIDAGIKVGLKPGDARELVLQTIIGSVKLVQEREMHPLQLRSIVNSPGGTTITGLHVLEKAAFKAAVMDGVEAAVKKSKELGKG